MNRIATNTFIAAGGLVLASSCVSLDSPGLAPAHPQRPTLSNDTYTTPNGMMEVETGAAVQFRKNSSVPTYLKYGMGERSEMYLGADLLKAVEDPTGNTHTGFGDINVGIRHRLRDKDEFEPGVAVQVRTKLPTASTNNNIGTGETDFFIGLSGEQDYKGNTFVGFYELGVLGEQFEPESDIEHLFALAGYTPINSKYEGYGEAAFDWIPEQSYDSLTLAGGVFYKIHPSLVVDVGLRVGLSSDAPDYQLLFGLTRALGKLGLRRDVR
jgi:outer membrane putative beta-barrel porin/alpha-amylase